MKKSRSATIAQPSANIQLPASEQDRPSPQGIGMAVAFDWGLAIQILVTPFLPFLLKNSEPFIKLKLAQPLATLVAFAISLPFAALLAFFGESVRRGRRWTRPVQIGFNTLGFLGGLASLINLWQSSKSGNYWPSVTAVILLIFSPLIAWRMSRPATGQWFTTVSSAAARKRHGGAWVFWIALWAIAGGILQAIAASTR